MSGHVKPRMRTRDVGLAATSNTQIRVLRILRAPRLISSECHSNRQRLGPLSHQFPERPPLRQDPVTCPSKADSNISPSVFVGEAVSAACHVPENDAPDCAS